MQFYCGRLYNFFRYRTKNTSIVFDLLPKQIEKIQKKEMTIDDIYDNIMKRPADYVRAVKAKNPNGMIAICGMVGNDLERSNGAGKSTILESMGYVLYGKIIRNKVNTDKTGDAGRSIITQIGDEFLSGIDESYAEWLFEHNNKIYRIKRGYSFGKSGKGSPKPILDFEDVTDPQKDSLKGHRTKDTSEEILKTIGLDFDIFSSSIMFGQSDAGKFLIKDDKDRKDMLIKILHLEEVINGCLEEVRFRQNEKERSLNSVRSQCELIRNNLSLKATVPNLKADIDNKVKLIAECENQKKSNDEQIAVLLQTDILKESENIRIEAIRVKADLENKTSEKNAQLQDWQSLMQTNTQSVAKKEGEIKDLLSRKSAISQKYSDLNSKIKNFNQEENQKSLATVERAKALKPKVQEELDKTNVEEKDLSSTLAVISSDIRKLTTEIGSLTTQLNAAGNNSQFVCDKCRSIVSRAHIEAELKKNNDAIITLNTSLGEKQSKEAVLKTKIEEFKDKRGKIDTWLSKEATLKYQAQEIENNKSVVKDLAIQITDYETSCEKCVKDKEEIVKQGQQYQTKIAEIAEKFNKDTQDLINKRNELKIRYQQVEEKASSVKAQINSLKTKNAELSQKNDTLNSQIGSFNKEIETIERDTKQLEELQKGIEEENKLLKRLFMLESIFGLEGIQTRIVNRHLTIFNQYITEFLTILSNGEMSVKVYTNDKGKIDIRIRGNSGNTYEMLSGGEKEILRLAVSTGLALLSFSRSAQKPEMIALDEVFGPLDNAHKNAVFKLLATLQSKFSRILVISHNPDINKAIPHKIIVAKGEGKDAASEIVGIT
jgi:DNA repair exonuclease SbcCD ATPase subunit